MNKARGTIDTVPEDDWSEAKKGLSLCLEPALLGRLVWWSRGPVAKNELSDVDCDPSERHRDSSLAGKRKKDGGENTHAGRVL